MRHLDRTVREGFLDLDREGAVGVGDCSDVGSRDGDVDIFQLFLALLVTYKALYRDEVARGRLHLSGEVEGRDHEQRHQSHNQSSERFHICHILG